MWCSAFETLTDLPDGVFKQEQVHRLEQGKCAVDRVRINKPDGLCACKCATYMHYVVCEQVIADAMIKGSVTGYPPNFDVLRIGQPVKTLGGSVTYRSLDLMLFVPNLHLQSSKICFGAIKTVFEIPIMMVCGICVLVIPKFHLNFT
jgi:hypothetical protein